MERFSRLNTNSVLCDYADIMARVALSATGRSLRSRQPRSMRGNGGPYQQLPEWQWHTATPAGSIQHVDLDRIIDGSFRLVDASNRADPCLRAAVEDYVTVIVRSQTGHNPDRLNEYLQHSGCLTNSAAA